MELKLQNGLQVKIAELLWTAESTQEVDRIIRVFDHDARVVYNMLLAQTYDQVQDTEQAERLLKKFQ